jgi:hypothetical protein
MPAAPLIGREHELDLVEAFERRRGIYEAMRA